MIEHYVDLSSYCHEISFNIDDVKNVGWIGRNQEFACGESEQKFIDKLKTIILKSGKGTYDVLVDKIRGSYECPICGEQELEIRDENTYFILGSAEVWIPDSKVCGNYFSVPGLIVHYIEDHQYRPPEEFINAVLEFNYDIDFNGQLIQDRLIEQHTKKSDQLTC
jgi:hypothetical protein